MQHALSEATVQSVLAPYRAALSEARAVVRVGSIAISVPRHEAQRAERVLRGLDELGVLPARVVQELFPDRASGRAVAFRTVLSWMRGQRASL